MEALYHYCSTQTFWSIVSNRSVRLSSLSLSNDTLEGKLVSKSLVRLAQRDGLDEYTIRRLLESVEHVERLADGLGFCLSEEPDLLSQWRGYAADATGISIGFSQEYLTWLGKAVATETGSGFSLNRVVYDDAEHDTHVEATYQEAKRLIEQGAYKRWGVRMLLDTRTDEEFERDRKEGESAFRSLSMSLLMLLFKLFLLKSFAFREEREWRLLAYFMRTGTDSCSFRATRDRIIPFREIPLLELERQPIREVVLAPKHITPDLVIEDFLRQNGFDNVQVRRSEASYR